MHPTRQLSERKARSRSSGIFYLSSKPAPSITRNGPPAVPPPLNGAILTDSHVMRNVLASAAEAELGALFDNCKEAIPIRTMLEEIGHPQPPTPVKTDNSTATGIIHRTVKQRRSKAIDMRFYWLQDRSDQDQFKFYWQKGADNKADYLTKHHPTRHHRLQRPVHLFTGNAVYWLTH